MVLNLMKLKHWTIITLVVGLGLLTVRQGPATMKRQFLVNHLLSSKNCTGCDLKGADLAGLDLSGINLTAANLAGANLRGAKLNNTILTDANLAQADLRDADLGCATVNFNLKADQETAKVNLTVDPASQAAITQRDHILDFNFDADGQGATMSFNFGGCANLEGANLAGATLPDGTAYDK
ncbi:pentapeptide repeat-containing protein [Leptolyngbya sp. NK1-12]|uniref:Pentapeptide repeat-containing protein n=1 Tax=Leptolyngbya sp. NK1-12 TaxID=2547451 RepID=A0AA97AGT9_9CYAN|nr:pentapeptide repeat-containing protein [Leptolyngbya sp. NK1-12]